MVGLESSVRHAISEASMAVINDIDDYDRCTDVNDVGVLANRRGSQQQTSEAVLECKFLNKDLLSIADDKPHCEAGLQLSCSKCDDIQDRKSAEKNVNTCANSCCDSLLPGDLNQFHIAGRIPHQSTT